jgi:uncharacterized protein (TIGR02646 family)
VKKIKRQALEPATAAGLRRLTAMIGNSGGRAQKAQQLWKTKSRVTFGAVAKVLGEMASGRGRCMYCEDSAGTDIEHFYPKQRYPERAFRWDNYLWACSHCNSNRKRTQFPVRGQQPLLIDPSAVDPMKHLQFLPATGEYLPIGTRGPESIAVFGLNDHEPPRKLPQARKDAFFKLQLLLEHYDAEQRAGRAGKAQQIKRIAKEEPFSAVFDWLLAIAQGPAAGRKTLRAGIPQLIKRHGIAGW